MVMVREDLKRGVFIDGLTEETVAALKERQSGLQSLIAEQHRAASAEDIRECQEWNQIYEEHWADCQAPEYPEQETVADWKVDDWRKWWQECQQICDCRGYRTSEHNAADKDYLGLRRTSPGSRSCSPGSGVRTPRGNRHSDYRSPSPSNITITGSVQIATAPELLLKKPIRTSEQIMDMIKNYSEEASKVRLEIFLESSLLPVYGNYTRKIVKEIMQKEALEIAFLLFDTERLKKGMTLDSRLK